MDLNILRDKISSLVCPATKRPLELLRFEDAEERAGAKLVPRADTLNTKGTIAPPAGKTDWVLLRDDDICAYPVVDGIPILLAPEALTPLAHQTPFDLTAERYAEAYEEMEFYNASAGSITEKLSQKGPEEIFPSEIFATAEDKLSFPAPWDRWVDAVYDSAAQWDAYEHLSPIREKTVLQLGGSGSHAVKFAMAGAAEAWSVTPMLGEAKFARALAESVGVGQQVISVVAVAEELPIKSDTIDAIFAGGCLHHMQTELAVPEAERVLRKGGKFAAVEPWRAPLYAIGTKVLGKREKDVYCRPLTKQRVDPMSKSFSSSRIIQHGTLTRYPLLALNKFGIDFKKSLPWYVVKIDDAVCSVIPGMRGMGSSIAVLGTK